MSSPKTTLFLVKIGAVFNLALAWFLAPYDQSAAVCWAFLAAGLGVVGVIMAHALHRSGS